VCLTVGWGSPSATFSSGCVLVCFLPWLHGVVSFLFDVFGENFVVSYSVLFQLLLPFPPTFGFRRTTCSRLALSDRTLRLSSISLTEQDQIAATMPPRPTPVPIGPWHPAYGCPTHRHGRQRQHSSFWRKRPVEAAWSVHVLPMFAQPPHLRTTHVRPLHVLALCVQQERFSEAGEKATRTSRNGQSDTGGRDQTTCERQYRHVHGGTRGRTHNSGRLGPQQHPCPWRRERRGWPCRDGLSNQTRAEQAGGESTQAVRTRA